MTSQESSLWTWRVQITISPAEGNQQAGSIVHLIIISHLAFNLIKSCHSPLIPLSPSAESMYQCVAGSIQLLEIEINTLSSSYFSATGGCDLGGVCTTIVRQDARTETGGVKSVCFEQPEIGCVSLVMGLGSQPSLSDRSNPKIQGTASSLLTVTSLAGGCCWWW